MARQTVFPQPLLVLGACGLLAAALVAQQPAAPPADAPFRNAALPIEQRVDAILAAMTLDEKLACLQTSTAVPRLGIPEHGRRGGAASARSQGRLRTGEADSDDVVRADARTRRHLGSRAAAARRRGAGRRGALHHAAPEVPAGGAGELAERRPGARPALGPLRGELQRGSVPDRHPRQRLHPRHPGRPSDILARGGAAQALRRQQQRDDADAILVRLRRAAVPGVLLGAVPHGHPGRRGALVHGVLQQVERRADAAAPDGEDGARRRVGPRRHLLDRSRGRRQSRQPPEARRDDRRGAGGDDQGRLRPAPVVRR